MMYAPQREYGFHHYPQLCEGLQVCTLMVMNDSTSPMRVEKKVAAGWKHMGMITPSGRTSFWEPAGVEWRLCDIGNNSNVVASVTTKEGQVHLYAPLKNQNQCQCVHPLLEYQRTNFRYPQSWPSSLRRSWKI